VVLTHADFDHAGSASVIREMTGAKIIIHKNDRSTLEEGRYNFPPGINAWGKISRAIFNPFLKRIEIPPQKADLILDNDDFLLDDFGIDGRLIYTPGHAAGSVSVLLDNGDLFAGCLAHNICLFTPGPRLPIYAENVEQIKKSWKSVISQGARMIYPGHGKPFLVDKIKNYL